MLYFVLLFALVCRLILEKRKISTQAVLFIGVLTSLISYLLVTDWQTISYDPCTEYSPFHHPNLFQNNSFLHSLPDHQPVNASKTSTLVTNTSFTLHPAIMFGFSNQELIAENYSTRFVCQKSNSCLVAMCKSKQQPTLLDIFRIE